MVKNSWSRLVRTGYLLFCSGILVSLFLLDKGVASASQPLEPLLEKIITSKESDRLPLLRILNRTKPTTAHDITALFQFVSHQENHVMVTAALNAIALTDNQLVGTAFIKGLASENMLIVTIAARMCGQLQLTESTKQLVQLIKKYFPEKEEKMQGQIIHISLLSLGDLRDVSTIPFILSLAGQVKGFDVEALNKFGTVALPKILQTLQNSDDEAVLQLAERVLNSLHDSAALPLLLKELDGQESRIKRGIIDALLRIDQEKMLPLLVDKWALKPDFIFEEELVEHLHFFKIYQPRYRRFLLAVLQGSISSESRQAAATVLGEIGGKEVEEGLQQAFCDRSSMVQMKAAKAYKKLTQDKHTARYLIKTRRCLGDEDSF